MNNKYNNSWFLLPKLLYFKGHMFRQSFYYSLFIMFDLVPTVFPINILLRILTSLSQLCFSPNVRDEQRNSLAFIYECCYVHVEVGNFSDHPRMSSHAYFTYRNFAVVVSKQLFMASFQFWTGHYSVPYSFEKEWIVCALDTFACTEAHRSIASYCWPFAHPNNITKLFAYFFQTPRRNIDHGLFIHTPFSPQTMDSTFNAYWLWLAAC